MIRIVQDVILLAVFAVTLIYFMPEKIINEIKKYNISVYEAKNEKKDKGENVIEENQSTQQYDKIYQLITQNDKLISGPKLYNEATKSWTYINKNDNDFYITIEKQDSGFIKDNSNKIIKVHNQLMEKIDAKYSIKDIRDCNEILDCKYKHVIEIKQNKNEITKFRKAGLYINYPQLDINEIFTPSYIQAIIDKETVIDDKEAIIENGDEKITKEIIQPETPAIEVPKKRTSRKKTSKKKTKKIKSNKQEVKEGQDSPKYEYAIKRVR